MTVLHGKLVMLRSATAEDSAMLATVRATPEVRQRWGGGDDLIRELLDDLATPELHVLVIEFEGRIVGAIQWEAEDDPMYRHAGIDVYIDPAIHGRGLGSDAVRTLARYLFEDHGHHRLVIDPAADNFAAIACYRKVGFRTVGVMREYERSSDGNWHDGLLMELLAGELTD
jgi:aminoglycoside 6'-N-acetyltransferase